MRFLTDIIDALADFVRRNPLTTLIIVFLSLAAPSLLKGIAAFVLYFLLGLVVFALVMGLLLRWRIAQARRRMEEQFGEQFGGGTPFGSADPFGGAARGGDAFGGRRARNPREGEVKIYVTSEAPEKRVAHGVGDYVDFEETKTDDKKR
ncbi:MAG TPA: DUF4834 family protein [Candidatus Alistipes merdavium]|nr:DUF4834 family protein [Candidatus Alistipes merdavium]